MCQRHCPFRVWYGDCSLPNGEVCPEEDDGYFEDVSYDKASPLQRLIMDEMTQEVLECVKYRR